MIARSVSARALLEDTVAFQIDYLLALVERKFNRALPAAIYIAANELMLLDLVTDRFGDHARHQPLGTFALRRGTDHISFVGDRLLSRLLAAGDLGDKNPPQYLANTRPWTRRGDEKAEDLLKQITREQQRDIERIVGVIEATREPLPTVQFPMAFTDTHDLSIEHLIREVTAYQKQDVASLESCVALAGADIVAKSLVEEVLGSARAHLELLEELSAAPAA